MTEPIKGTIVPVNTKAPGIPRPRRDKSRIHAARDERATSISAIGHRPTAAYRRLKVDPTTVRSGPQCTPFFRQLPGGLPFVLDALRESALPEARAVMAAYDNPKFPAHYREVLPLEAFCAKANVCPSRLTEVAVAAIAKSHVLRGAVIAALAHPEVMETNARMAKEDEGIEDRMAHLKMVGAMPMPKSSQTVVNVNATAHAAAAAQSTASAPSPEDTIRRIVEARQRQSALVAGRQESLPPAPVAFQPKEIEAEYVDTEE